MKNISKEMELHYVNVINQVQKKKINTTKNYKTIHSKINGVKLRNWSVTFL